MFIRKTTTRSRSVVESSFTFRLVASERTGSQVRQITLLNLSRHFDLPQPDWPRLCARIEALLAGQPDMLPEPETIEALAQRFAARLIAAQPGPGEPAAAPPSPAPDAAQSAPGKPSAAATAPAPIYAEVDSLPLRRRRSPRCNSPGPAPSASKPPVSPRWTGSGSTGSSWVSASTASSATRSQAC